MRITWQMWLRRSHHRSREKSSAAMWCHSLLLLTLSCMCCQADAAGQRRLSINSGDGSHVTQLIARAEGLREAGERHSRGKRFVAARGDFDAAIDVILESGVDLRHSPRLAAYFDRLVERIHAAETSAHHTNAQGSSIAVTTNATADHAAPRRTRAGGADNPALAAGDDAGSAPATAETSVTTEVAGHPALVRIYNRFSDVSLVHTRGAQVEVRRHSGASPATLVALSHHAGADTNPKGLQIGILGMSEPQEGDRDAAAETAEPWVLIDGRERTRYTVNPLATGSRVIGGRLLFGGRRVHDRWFVLTPNQMERFTRAEVIEIATEEGIIVVERAAAQSAGALLRWWSEHTPRVADELPNRSSPPPAAAPRRRTRERRG